MVDHEWVDGWMERETHTDTPFSLPPPHVSLYAHRPLPFPLPLIRSCPLIRVLFIHPLYSHPCFFVGDEIVSDAYKMVEVDDVAYEVDCKMITIKEGAVDIGANASAEGEVSEWVSEWGLE